MSLNYEYVFFHMGFVELCIYSVMGFPDDSAGKEFACNAGDTGDAGSIPGW